MDNNTFWGRVRPLIKAQKMTHRQFAEYLGVPANTFHGWVRYNRIPDTSTAYDIAIALGVTLNYLLGGMEAQIADWRLKELTAREAAAKILKLADQIQEEAAKLRPLMKISSNSNPSR
jgi:transcriptional regulator with XRE-family HTH domain